MPQIDAVQLRSSTLGPLPLLQYFLEKIGLDALLAVYAPATDRRFAIPPAAILGLLVRNILLGRTPLYGLGEWAQAHDPRALGTTDDVLAGLNDDRAGRALDYLFDADRASLVTALAVRAIRAFDVALDQLHNDSTSITFTGGYVAAGGRVLRGKKALRITHGHNKDHRPDLKQLLWILTVTADGSVPIHYKCCDGNTNDDPTHIETWSTLRMLAGRPDFLYVADSKLCSRKNLDYIHSEHGRFICVLPRNRKEDAWFRAWLQTHTPEWVVAIDRSVENESRRTPDIWMATESPNRSGEGYRIIWVKSLRGAERDKSVRLAAIRRACEGIESLNQRLQGPKARFRDRAVVAETAEATILKAGARRWVSATVTEHRDATFRQSTRGRPGPNTQYTKTERVRYSVDWKEDPNAIDYDARSDGMYPLITNCEDLLAKDVLIKHKYQPTLEKRHEQMKTVYSVAPVFLKNEGRIEALLLMYYAALLIQALVERQLRKGMEAAGLAEIPLYPEARDCRAPTANRVFEVFAAVQRHELLVGDRVERTFEPELNPLQRQILALLGVPESVYTPARH